MAASVEKWMMLCFALLPTCGTAEAKADIPPAYRWAAQANGVPSSVLFAVALQESGTLIRGRFIPWPWTLNVRGSAHRYPNRATACTALMRALRNVPPTHIDVGLGQLNVGYQGHRSPDSCALLDPYRNLLLAGTILREQQERSDDWLTAVGRYHRPAGGEPALRYRRRVEQHVTRIVGPQLASSILRGSAQ